MARSRRLSAAFLVALALAALVAAATVAGSVEQRVAVADGKGAAGTTLQSEHAQPALTPAKRQAAEHVSFVLLAVLAALAGVVTAGRWARRPVGRGHAPFAVARRALRLRGPPVLLFTP